MTKDLIDSDSASSANDNPKKDEDFDVVEEAPESASEVESTKVKKSPKKTPKKSTKKRASKKSKKSNKKSPAKAAKKKSSIIVEEKDPLSNSDEEQAKDAEESEEEYEVEAIVGHREYNGKLVYKIRWKGYGASSDTWEEADSLSCPDILDTYNIKNKVKTLKRKSIVSKKVKSPSKKRKNSDSGNDDQEASSLESVEDKLSESEAGSDDYEVDKLIEVRKKRDGSREFLVRWKKWSPKYDTWEPENNLSCPELIEKFMAENVVATKKSTSTKELRATPKARKSITFSTQNDNRRSSKRNTAKVTYGEEA